jgi:hypothetical protein
MPYLHGVEADDREFRKKTETFFCEILTRIPAQGLKLDIELEDDTQPVSKDNFPKNIPNYIAWRHAINHPSCAMSKAEADRDPTKHFYIEDPEHITTADLEINGLEDKALTLYFKYKDDELKLDQILTMLGIDTKRLTASDKQLRFKVASKRTEGPNISEVDQRQQLTRFIDICEDPDLTMRYLIQELVGAQVLERQGTTIFIKESGEAIGANGKEAVAFLKNPKNSRIYNMLRAHYETLIIKPSKSVLKAKEKEEENQKEEIDAPEETGRRRAKPQVD